VAGEDRIVALDVLRGAAVLGILVMNIQGYSMIHAAYFFPTAFGDLSGANYWVWYLSDLLFSQKFITIFSLLFGAGIVLMNERAAATRRGFAGLHYRRMAWLLVIGLLHTYLLWDGDILVSYALCGLVVFLFRRVRPGRLLVSSLAFLLIGSGLMCLGGWSSQFWGPEALADFHAEFLPGADQVAAELANWRRGWQGEWAERWPASFQMHTQIFPFYMFWRAGGTMLLGMALFKWGFLGGRKSGRLYGGLIAAALLIGLPLNALGTHRQVAADWEPVYSFFIASQYGYWASFLIALGWISAILLVWRQRLWPGLCSRFAAAGRLALTNYLLQTLICTTLFYGHGLGLIGRVSRVGQVGIVIGIWILQLALSPVWLRHFRFGPAEWLWRSLSYRRWQPLRR